jgi:hypothetical protein
VSLRPYTSLQGIRYVLCNYPTTHHLDNSLPQPNRSLPILDPGSSIMPSPEFLALPAEVRVNIYKHISPVNTSAADYSGLLASCRLVRKEWSWEARKIVLWEYNRFRTSLAPCHTRFHTPAMEMLSSSSITLEIPLTYSLHGFLMPPHIIPWHWSWLTDIHIIFSTEYPMVHQRTFRERCSLNMDYHEMHEQLHNIILVRTAPTIPGYDGVCSKAKRPTIKNISLDWYNVRSDEFNVARSIMATNYRNYRPTWQDCLLPSRPKDYNNPARLWDVRTHKREIPGNCFSVVWRRRDESDIRKRHWEIYTIWCGFSLMALGSVFGLGDNLIRACIAAVAWGQLGILCFGHCRAL